MCGYTNGPTNIRIRDGTTTTTIPNDPTAYNTIANATTGAFLYGMHESYSYYQQCRGRSRNQGLYIADQNVGNNGGATNTRQNPGGTQYGFECSEERDYYPWWGPSPWKDIAIFTDQSDNLCSYYQAESQNVKDRYYCNGSSAITKQGCEAGGGSWLRVPNWGIGKPACFPSPWNRDNHLGNGVHGVTNSYNWSVPTSTSEKCVIGNKCVCALRIRYNITSAEIDGFGVGDGQFVDSSYNGNPIIYTNPNVQVQGQNLTLAVNTAQYGRTFQDRSYTFYILNRPKGIPADANIYNLNVRGKRGNIVQVYPATEYDFVPETLIAKVGDYVHYQWTGCDTNPQNNEGEGTPGTDRSNLVQIKDQQYNEPITDAEISYGASALFESSSQRYLMAFLGQTNCPTYAQLLASNNNNQGDVDEDPTNCMKLNAASAYFNGGLIQLNNTGTFYYMSTRNNNFSNRSQKGTMIVLPLLEAWVIALIVIGCVFFAAGGSIGGAYVYARLHPHSKVADMFDNVGRRFRSISLRNVSN